MPSRFTAQSGKGALLVALALVATLLVPSVYTWAVKSGTVKSGVEPFGSKDKRDIDLDALSYFQRNAVPLQERALDLSPLGNFKPNNPTVDHRKGLIETAAGYFNPKDAKAFDALPSDLRPVAAHPAPQGKGMGLGSTTGIIQISESALKSTGFDKIEARIEALGVKVLDSRQDRAFTVRGSDQAMAALLAEPFLEAAIPYGPAFKLDAMTGKQMLLDKVRANKLELDVHVILWDDANVGAVLKDLQQGHKDTVSLLEDGKTIRATLDKNELKRVLKMEEVRHVREIPEYQLTANFVRIQDL